MIRLRLFFVLRAGGLYAQDFSGFAVMHNGDTLHAKVIRHTWSWDKFGQLKILDFDGNHHEIPDNKYKLYSSRGRFFAPISFYDYDKRRTFFVLMRRETTGYIEVYDNLDRDNTVLYIRSPLFNGYYSKKVFNEVFLPILKTCSEFNQIFPNGKVPGRIGSFIKAIQRFNDTCIR